MESDLHQNAKRSKLHAPLAAAGNDGALLPTDLLCDILLRLPADELCRLRLVCRSWRSLTSDPIFAKAHSSRHPLVVGLRSAVSRRPGHRDLEVQFLDPFSGAIVKRIPLARPPWKGHELRAHHCRLFIFNGYGPEKARVLDPATGSFTMLPTTSVVTWYDERHVMYSSVFGRVPSTGEYKALRIRHERWYQDHEPAEQSYHVAKLGLDGSGSNVRWRVKPSWPPVRVSLGSQDSALVNGVAYFLLHLDDAMSDEIAAFDLTTEEWRQSLLRGPLSSQGIRAKEEDRVCFSLANLNGSLVCICDYTRSNLYEDCSMELWFLVDTDKVLWTKRYSLRSDRSFIPLWILDDGRLLTCWVDGPEELRAYDPMTDTWTNLSMVEKL